MSDEPITVQLKMVCRDGHMLVFDSLGRQISLPGESSGLDGLGAYLYRVTRWRNALVAAQLRLRGRSVWRQATPWERKCSVWASSLRLRGKDQARRRTRAPFTGRFKTTTWQSACQRFQTQLGLLWRRYVSPPWTRWAHTASSNLNKRKGGRYGR